MKKTKKAKTVILGTVVRTVVHYTYDCPTCRTVFTDHTLSDKITRFKCGHCDQELIVKND